VIALNYLTYKLNQMSLIFKLLRFLGIFLLLLIASYCFIQFALNYFEIDVELLPVCISLIIAGKAVYNDINKCKN